MQKEDGTEVDYTHGVVDIGAVRRRMYFDLGGVYDLIDDECYEELRQGIQTGAIPHARILTLAEMGYTERGVPIDVAAANTGAASIVWVKR